MVAAKRARRRGLALVAALAVAGVAPVCASAEPAATIRIIVPLPAGGGVDVVARELAERIARATGATFVVENRPGAGTIIGSEAVARAAPDGHTLLLVPNSFVVAPQLHKVNYDAIAGFAPICSLVATPTTWWSTRRRPIARSAPSLRAPAVPGLRRCHSQGRHQGAVRAPPTRPTIRERALAAGDRPPRARPMRRRSRRAAASRCRAGCRPRRQGGTAPHRP